MPAKKKIGKSAPTSAITPKQPVFAEGNDNGFPGSTPFDWGSKPLVYLQILG